MALASSSIRNSSFDIRHSAVPTHVAIIMDGNRRWARQRGLSAIMGHDKAARDVIEPIVDQAIELGIKFLTFWAFSTENWKRDKAEINALMGIFREGLDKLGAKLHEKGVKLHIIGEMNKFPKDIQEKSRYYMDMSRGNTKITVSFALNYGGRDEILRGIKRLWHAIHDSRFTIHDLSEESFGQFLDTAGMPDPDLIIRTGGEFRLSGYFPWQSVYSELYFTDTLWPDFTPAEFDKALEDFARRERRFGGGGNAAGLRAKGQRLRVGRKRAICFPSSLGPHPLALVMLAQVRIDEVFKFQGDVVKNITEFQTINAYVSAVLPNVYTVAGIFLFGLILFGGFQYITGAGDEEKLKKGKAVLTSALLGFAILFGSIWIMKIIQVLTGVPILNPSI